MPIVKKMLVLLVASILYALASADDSAIMYSEGADIVLAPATNRSVIVEGGDLYIKGVKTATEAQLTELVALEAKLTALEALLEARNDALLFKTTWNTSKTATFSSNANQIRLPLEPTGSYDFRVDWGDGSHSNISAYDAAETIHTYTHAGEYAVKISGALNGWRFGATSQDHEKLTSVDQWGAVKLGNNGAHFSSVRNLQILATDAPDLSEVTSLDSSFFKTNLGTTGNLNAWDVSNVKSMQHLFGETVHFNQPLSNWDTSAVENMSNMFAGAIQFNQPLNAWNVSSVTFMSKMFQRAESFNQPLDQWNTNNVVNMEEMFRGAINFNQPIEMWNMESVTSIQGMFHTAHSFNQPLAQWNLNSLLFAYSVFYDAQLFDQPIHSWNVSRVSSFDEMFEGALAFNRPLATWDTREAKTFYFTFSRAASFDQNLNSWDTSKATLMTGMFDGALSFNKPLNQWDTSNVQGMDFMFNDADAFNQDLSSWCTVSLLSSPPNSFDAGASSWTASRPVWNTCP